MIGVKGILMDENHMEFYHEPFRLLFTNIGLGDTHTHNVVS